MTNPQPAIRLTDRIGWPWDLRDWVGAEALLRAVEEEVGTLNWGHPALADYLRAHPEEHPRMMLTLLAYAYATGVYASEDIAEQCRADAIFRRICGPHPPSTAQVAAFRRDNRGLLKWCLAQVLRRALRERFGLHAEPLHAGLRRLVTDAAVRRLELARHLDHSQREF